jgi:hypothetical protein
MLGRVAFASGDRELYGFPSVSTSGHVRRSDAPDQRFRGHGSIGQNTLDLIARAPDDYDVVALTGGGNIANWPRMRAA